MKIAHSKPYFDDSDLHSVSEVLKKRFVSAGDLCREFGQQMSGALNRKWGIPTQSGTDALTAALKLTGGDKGKVLVPAYICSAVLDALAANNLEPVPVDVDRKTLSISTEIANSLDVSIVVGAHLFGIPAPFERLENKILIEDCAQTLDPEQKFGVGTNGKFVVCSFYATKLLTTGHGGMLLGDCPGDYEKAMNLFVHDKQEAWTPHWHFLMSDFNAALGITQLNKLPGFLEERQKIAGRYIRALTGGENMPSSFFSRFLVAVEDDSIDSMIEHFNDQGIEAKRPVYKPLYRYLNRADKDFPNAAWADKHIISVPIYPGMEEGEIDKVESFLEKNKNALRCWPSA
jgi:dTDP-4-amino-4,6-dideoxygalactose transaminase